MNSYELSRKWFDFAFSNPSKIKPVHGILYFFCIEHCNRLGWKKEFGLPTTMAKEAVGIRSYNTYIDALNDLVEFGFIKLVEKSKNQYSSNIIALSNFNKAHDNALDKALIKHTTKQSESTVQSIDSIDKQYNNEQYNNKPEKKDVFNFKSELLKLAENKDLVEDWLRVRKTKKATNTKTALNSFLSEIEKSGMSVDYVLYMCVNKSWSGFNAEWIKSDSITPKSNIAKSILEGDTGW
jgi:hypothetical protein